MKCVIIGGGVSGLMAAKELAAKDWDVTVIESRARLGGRIRTLHSHGLPIELGPEFVHGTPQETHSLLSDPKNQIRPLEEMQDVFWRGEMRHAKDFWQKAEEFMKTLPDKPPDQSVADALINFDADPIDQALIHNFMEGFNAADANLMSGNALAQENARAPRDAMDNFRLLTGYDFLVHSLEQKLNALRVQVQLTSRATKIEWREGQAYVHITRDGLEKREPARAVLITVPTSIYNPNQSRHIQFAPDIPDHRAAAQKLPMGPVHKVVLLFKEPMIPRAAADIHFIHSPEFTFGSRWSWNWTKPYAMTCWSGGRRAESLKHLTPKEIFELCVKELSEVCELDNQKVFDNILEWHYHDWVHDPDSRGAYSYVALGGAGAREQLAKPIANTLFFAGEATVRDGSAGTVHGALRSGIRAANEISQLN